MIKIRKGEVKDIESIAELQVLLAAETEGLKLEKEVVSKGAQAVFDDPAKGRYYMAEHAGKIVGMLLAIPEWSDWRNATVLWIHSLYILPEERGKGVFRKMYDYLKELVEKSDELAGLRLFVDKGNEKAQRIYEKVGMNKDHYVMYEWLK